MNISAIRKYYNDKGCLEIDTDKSIINQLLDAGYTLKTPLLSSEVRLVIEFERMRH